MSAARRLRAGSAPVLGAAFVALCGTYFAATWNAAVVVPLVLTVVVTSTSVAVLTVRLPSWAASITSLGVLVVAGPLLIALATRSAPAWAEVLTGFVDGWRGALQTTLPAPEEPGLLAIVAGMVWIAAAVTGRALVTSEARAAALVPGLVVLVVAGLYAPDGPPVDSRAVALVASGALLLAARAGGTAVTVRTTTEDHEGSGGTAAAGFRTSTLTGILVVALLAVMVATSADLVPLSGLNAPASLRDSVDPPPIDDSLLSPLAEVRRLRSVAAEDPQLILRSDDQLPPRVRLATLDRFDGTNWSSTATFRPAGRDLPVETAGSIVHRRVRLDVSYEALRSPLVPVAGQPVRAEATTIDGDPLALRFDQTSATLLVDDGSPGRVEVELLVPEPTSEDYRGAAAGGDPTLDPFVTLPTPTHDAGARALEELRNFVTESTRAAAGPFGQATALHQAFEDRFSVTDDPETTIYGGHGLYLVNELLGEDAGRVRAEDQLAGAYALAARMLNLPTRVATGFVVPDGNEVTLTGADAAAWPEVYFEELGWVPFPVDVGTTEREAPDDDPFEEARSEEVIDQQEGGRTRPEGVDPFAEHEEEVEAARDQERSTALLVGAAGLVALLVAFGAAHLLARRRRRARRLGPPARRVAGAWLEALDDLDAAGIPPARRTAGELVAEVGDSHGPEVAALLASLARRVAPVLYGDGGASDADADAAWSDASELGGAIGRHMGRRRRLVEALDPRRGLRAAR